MTGTRTGHATHRATRPATRRNQGGAVALSRPVRLAPADMLGLGLLGIRTRKLRAALSALGISIGIATVIIVTGIPASGQEALMNKLTALGTNMLQAVPAQLPTGSAPPFSRQSLGMVSRIGPVTIASAVADDPNGAAVYRSAAINPANDSGLTVAASRLNLLQAVNGTVQSGRFLNAVSERFPTVVLGSQAASTLGFARLTPGFAPQILINDRWFTVIGILNPLTLFPEINQSVLIGWDAARTQLGFDPAPTEIYLQANQAALQAVRGVLPATIDPQEPYNVQVSLPSAALAAKIDTQDTFSALFLGLAGIALLVGGIGVANTMVISVLERRREIGLRRALGASRGQIRGQFLTESVALSGLGGLAGILLGTAAIVSYTAYQRWPPVIPPLAALGGLAGALFIGMAAGVYPSIRASLLTPTEALAAP
jgi:putative ABC transport system permease protein